MWAFQDRFSSVYTPRFSLRDLFYGNIARLEVIEACKQASKGLAYEIEHENRQGRPRTLKVIDELFLTLNAYAMNSH